MKTFHCFTVYSTCDGLDTFTRRHGRTAETAENALTAEIHQAVARIEGGMGEDGFRVHRVSVIEVDTFGMPNDTLRPESEL